MLQLNRKLILQSTSFFWGFQRIIETTVGQKSFFKRFFIKLITFVPLIYW